MQQEDEEQVLEGDYEVFREAVSSALAPFHSSADNADDLDQEIRSLIPTDDIPKEHRTKIVQEQVRILHKSNKAVSAAVAAASNLQLMRRDVALLQLQLEDVHMEHARTAPFHGNNLVGPNEWVFDE